MNTYAGSVLKEPNVANNSPYLYYKYGSADKVLNNTSSLWALHKLLDNGNKYWQFTWKLDITSRTLTKEEIVKIIGLVYVQLEM